MEESELIKKLREGGLRIVSPKHDSLELPKVNYDLFRKPRVDYLRRAVEGIHEFLCENYIIEDNLNDDNRDDIEDTLAEKYGAQLYDLLQKNNLRVNVLMGHVLSPMKNIAKYLNEPIQEITDIAEEMDNRFYGKYTLLSNPDRVRFVQDLENKIIRILGILSNN